MLALIFFVSIASPFVGSGPRVKICIPAEASPETKAGSKGEGFSATLWSIDITGYNERKLTTKTDASDPSWSSLLSK